ncbi:hypothetical protein [Micromonospora zamorensis]|uniref:hypothetical protein n=1 Tax=Micromonospora zamorensis TaxID=709883 RepID=UPI0033B7D839
MRPARRRKRLAWDNASPSRRAYMESRPATRESSATATRISAAAKSGQRES